MFSGFRYNYRVMVSAQLGALFVLFSLGKPHIGHTDIIMTSGAHQTQLVELFTSQGCSSCPPADRWLNALSDSELLWTSVVPVSFHVDYWNNLGWEDPFSSPAFSHRQREYRKKGNINAVYTPGFVINGEEWRGYFQGASLPKPKPALATLKAVVRNDRVDVEFIPTHNRWSLPININIAFLGHDIHTPVSAGENARRTLKQGFVVLNYDKVTSNTRTIHYPVPDYKREGVARYAIAIWASHPLSFQVLQAVGAWLGPAKLP